MLNETSLLYFAAKFKGLIAAWIGLYSGGVVLWLQHMVLKCTLNQVL